MRERIEKELRELERRENAVVLYAAESGSRAWGFASRDSDWDVRFVYVRPIDWYLSVYPGRDVIEQPIDDGLDLSGWDLRKALALFRKGNAALAEWLRSPIVYREEPMLAEPLRAALARSFQQRSFAFHYLAMAKKNYRGYLRRDRVRTKKYFYVLRALLAASWVCRRGDAPPVPFQELVTEELDETLRTIVDDLLTRKRAGDELADGPRIEALNDFIEREIERISAIAPQQPVGRPMEAEQLDTLFRKILRSTGQNGS